MKKTVVITGTSSGVGLELALLLALNDFQVYATMRNLDKAEVLRTSAEVENLDIRILELDVTSEASIDKCFKQIIAEAGKIDILVNNAGAGFIRSTEQATLDEIRWVTDTNYLSVVMCTKAVIGHMRERRSGHIINVSSIGGLVGQPFNELYCAAKFAVEGYTEAMANYLTQAFNINFTLVEPGGIKTEFATSVRKSIEETGGILDDEYQKILEQYLSSRTLRNEDAYQTALEVAEVIHQRVIEVAHPPVRIRTSEWANQICDLKTGLDPDGLKLKNYVEKYFLGIQ